MVRLETVGAPRRAQRIPGADLLQPQLDDHHSYAVVARRRGASIRRSAAACECKPMSTASAFDGCGLCDPLLARPAP